MLANNQPNRAPGRLLRHPGDPTNPNSGTGNQPTTPFNIKRESSAWSQLHLLRHHRRLNVTEVTGKEKGKANRLHLVSLHNKVVGLKSP